MTAFTSRVVSAQQLERLSLGVQGAYGFLGDHGAVATHALLEVDVAAIPAGGYKIDDLLQSHAYAASTVTSDAADAANPRIDVVKIDASGTVAIEKGTAAATPVPPDLASTEIAIAMLLLAANATAYVAGDIIDQRQRLVDMTQAGIVQTAVEDNLSPIVTTLPLIPGSLATGDRVGGFKVFIAGDGVTLRPSAASDMHGGWHGALNGHHSDDVGVYTGGGALTAAGDFVIGGRIKLGSEWNPGGHNLTLGLASRNNLYSRRNNDVIAWTVVGADAWTPVCDAGGTETTGSTAANDTDEHTWRIEISGGGTSVAFYWDNVLIDTITTNIPSAGLYFVCGATARSSGDDGDFHFKDFYIRGGN